MLDTELLGMEHAFIFGAEYSVQNVVNGTYLATPTGTSNCQTNGRGGVRDGYCIEDAEGNAVDNVNSLMQRTITKNGVDADYSIETISLYAIDTVDLTDAWTLAGGLRLDYFDYQNVVTNRDGTKTNYTYDDTIV